MHLPSWLPRPHVLPSFLLFLLMNILMGTTDATLVGRDMRIQPLGDSITFGYLSSDGNGYRNYLLERLIAPVNSTNGTTTPANNTVLYVGSVQWGNMTNNENEGHPGTIISQIAVYANLSLPERPNVVLLHAGTNDMTFNVLPTTAPTRLSALIDQIHAQCPDALILVAKILNAANSATESRLTVYNAAIPAIVQEKVDGGMKVQMVDMTGISTGLLKDGLHPTDAGYDAMSEVWYQGLVEADEKGWIGSPVATTVTSAVVSDAATATIRLITSVLPSATAKSGAGLVKAQAAFAGLLVPGVAWLI